MGQSTSLAAPFDNFNGWSIKEVEELRKKYFLMDLNFGVDVSDLKDWLDIDTDSAGEIVAAFAGEAVDRISAMNLLSGLAMCVRGDVEEKIQVIFACFDFEDMQKLDEASLGVLFLATACGAFSLLQQKINCPKNLVRALVHSVASKGAKDAHIGSFQKWCDEQIDEIGNMTAMEVILALGFKQVNENRVQPLKDNEVKQSQSEVESKVSDVQQGSNHKSQQDDDNNVSGTGSGSNTESKADVEPENLHHGDTNGTQTDSSATTNMVQPSVKDPMKSALFEKPEAGVASAAFSYRGPEAERKAKATYAASTNIENDATDRSHGSKTASTKSANDPSADVQNSVPNRQSEDPGIATTAEDGTESNQGTNASNDQVDRQAAQPPKADSSANDQREDSPTKIIKEKEFEPELNTNLANSKEEDAAAAVAAEAAVESLTQLSAMYERTGVGTASSTFAYRGPEAEAMAKAAYPITNADAIDVD